MKALFPGVFLFFILSAATAQKPPLKFGDIAMEEMKMTSYDKDPSVPAVILGDYGESTIVNHQNNRYRLEFDRVTRIKIFTKEGLDRANFTIRLNKSGSAKEDLSFLRAVTYNLENGKIVATKVNGNGIYKGNFDAHYDFVKVTCPKVQEGSIIEISYKVTSESLYNFHDWVFQSTIPTVLSEYHARIPEYFKYLKYTTGNVPLVVSDVTRVTKSLSTTSFERQGKNVVRHTVNRNNITYIEERQSWVASDVPAFTPEPFMTSVNNHISRLQFELGSVKYPNEPIAYYNEGTWTAINNSFIESENFGGEITGNGFLKKIANDITTGLQSPEEKIAMICNYVKQNITWDGKQALVPVIKLERVFKNKTGNSAEINLLLASLLEKANIPVSPVLLSTRDHGPVDESIPLQSQFNYVVCLAHVNGESYLLDATDKLLPLGLLPEQCLNGRGLSLSEDGFQWVPLHSQFKTHMVTSANFILSENGKLKGKLKLDVNGYAAHDKRKRYLTQGEKEYLKDFMGIHSWELTSSEIQNSEEIRNNLIEVHELIINENVTLAGGMVYLDPFICNAQKYNPFKSDMRKYPVDLGNRIKETFFFNLTLPEDYTIEELPKSKTIIMPQNWAKYSYNVSQSGDLISITSIFNINKSLFTQDEYPYLREFYNQIVAMQAEPIVLKKK